MQPVKALNHIGIAVQSIDAQRPFYEEMLGAEFEGYEDVPSQKVRVGFFGVSDVRLELLEPVDGEGPVAKFLEKRGEGLHHLVKGLLVTLQELAESDRRGHARLLTRGAWTGTGCPGARTVTPGCAGSRAPLPG